MWTHCLANIWKVTEDDEHDSYVVSNTNFLILSCLQTQWSFFVFYTGHSHFVLNHHHHHHHKHQGLDPLIRSVSKVTNALSNVSSVFQLFSFCFIYMYIKKKSRITVLHYFVFHVKMAECSGYTYVSIIRLEIEPWIREL